MPVQVSRALSLHDDPTLTRNRGEHPDIILDTIGVQLSLQGILRVLACAYIGGWDPPYIIIVHSEREERLQIMAETQLGGGFINSLNFARRSFWKNKKNGT